MKLHNSFVAGFSKGAAVSLPRWAHEMTRVLDPVKSMPAYSKKGVEGMWRRRKVKDAKHR